MASLPRPVVHRLKDLNEFGTVMGKPNALERTVSGLVADRNTVDVLRMSLTTFGTPSAILIDDGKRCFAYQVKY